MHNNSTEQHAEKQIEVTKLISKIIKTRSTRISGVTLWKSEQNSTFEDFHKESQTNIGVRIVVLSGHLYGQKMVFLFSYDFDRNYIVHLGFRLLAIGDNSFCSSFI